MARDPKTIKIINGALDETPLRGGTTILRGVIAPECLNLLQFDDYQREALPLSSLRKLTAAITAGEALPDIEIGMRGNKVSGGKEKDIWHLHNDCYVIDGQQRVNACRNALLLNAAPLVHLGAVVHFSTDRNWERDRFRVLNSDRIKVSPNILIRNIKDDHPAVKMLYAMTDSANTAFPLAGRVSWSQNMKRSELLTALNMLKVVGRLHTHVSAGQASRYDELAVQLDTIGDKLTLGMMRDNVQTFFDFIDQTWGIRTVQYREFSRHLASAFLWMLARVLSNHVDFWKNSAQGRLFIDVENRKKFKSFPLNDPGISQLMAAGGKANTLLYDQLVKHLNSGRRTNRLKARATADCECPEDEAPATETAE